MSNFTAISLTQMKSQGNIELFVYIPFATYMIRKNESWPKAYQIAVFIKRLNQIFWI